MIRGGYWEKGEIWQFFSTLIQIQKKMGHAAIPKKYHFFGRSVRIILKPGYFFVFLFMKDKIGAILPGYHFRAIPLFFFL